MPSYFVEVWSLLGVKQNLSQAQIGLLYFRLSSLHCLFHMVVTTPPPPQLPPPERSKAVQEKLKRWGTPLTATSPHLMECGFRNNGNFCLWNTECGKSLLSSCGIWNTAQGIRNLTNDCNPESTFHWQRSESTTWNLESTAWNPESKTALDSLTLGELW